MNIIVVSTEPPDPFGNAAGRWYYVLAKGLSERGHRVRWLGAYTSSSSAARAQACFEHADIDLRLYQYPTRPWLSQKLHTVRRPYSHFISTSLVHDLTDALTHGYDVLHLEQTWAGWLGLNVPRTVLSVLSLACIDLATIGNTSLRSLVTGQVMKWAERHVVRGHQTIRGVSGRDCEILQRMNPKARIAEIPLALDQRLYEFNNQQPEVPTIGMIGSMNWGPTRMAATRLIERIWPLVREQVRGLRLVIAGWGARQAFQEHLGDSRVSVLENLSEIEPFFRSLSLLVFPQSQGSGTKVKVLEAMAYGVPVVTTPEGIQGIFAVPGVDAALASDDKTLASLVVELMENGEARRAMSLAARKMIEQKHSPSPVLEQVESLFELVMNGTGS